MTCSVSLLTLYRFGTLCSVALHGSVFPVIVVPCVIVSMSSVVSNIRCHFMAVPMAQSLGCSLVSWQCIVREKSVASSSMSLPSFSRKGEYDRSASLVSWPCIVRDKSFGPSSIALSSLSREDEHDRSTFVVASGSKCSLNLLSNFSVLQLIDAT